MASRNKVAKMFSLDIAVVEAFEKFVPNGEQSSTLNEILKDFLEKRGRMGEDKSAILVDKTLQLERLASEVSLLKKEFDEKERISKERLLSEKVKLENSNLLSKLNEDAKYTARRQILVEAGLPADLEKFPESRHSELVSLWRKRTDDLLREKIQNG